MNSVLVLPSGRARSSRWTASKNDLADLESPLEKRSFLSSRRNESSATRGRPASPSVQRIRATDASPSSPSGCPP